jgi:hypothetical protein
MYDNFRMSLFTPNPSMLATEISLTQILIPSRVYLIDTGNKGRARDSRNSPPPHPPGDLLLTDGPDESR